MPKLKSLKIENLGILPFGASEHEKWGRVLRTTYLEIICFAQLRAEIAENGAGEAGR